jgi:hypothetical protein
MLAAGSGLPLLQATTETRNRIKTATHGRAMGNDNKGGDTQTGHSILTVTGDSQAPTFQQALHGRTMKKPRLEPPTVSGPCMTHLTSGDVSEIETVVSVAERYC